MNHTYLKSLIYGRPLLIEPNKLHVILGVLGEHLEIEVPVIIAAATTQPVREPQPSPKARGIAVIDVMGSLVHRTRGLQADSGMASYESIGNQLIAAAHDPQIGGILLHIDSPGGEVAGAYPLAHTVRDVAKDKPVWAVVDEAAWSAGYLIASQASRVVLSENGSVGSIGICLIHRDQSSRDEKAGDKYTFLYRGARKNDFNPHAPLSDEAQMTANRILDREYLMFVDYVASSRKLPHDKVQATEASLIYGKDAISGGFADDFMTIHDAAGEMSKQIQAGTSISMKGARRVSDSNTPEDAVTETAAASPPTPPPAQNGATATAKGPTAGDYEEIAEACLLARKPHLTAEFIQQRKTVAEVKKILLEQAAAEDEQNETFSAFPPAHGAEHHQKPPMTLKQRMAEKLAIK